METKYNQTKEEIKLRSESRYAREVPGLFTRVQDSDADYAISDVTFFIHPLLIANGINAYGRVTIISDKKLVDERVKLIDALDRPYLADSDVLEDFIGEKIWGVEPGSLCGKSVRQELVNKLTMPIKKELENWYESLSKEEEKRKKTEKERGLITKIANYLRK